MLGCYLGTCGCYLCMLGCYLYILGWYFIQFRLVLIHVWLVLIHVLLVSIHLQLCLKFYQTYLRDGSPLRNFYAGAADGYNMNNNGLESQNGLAKGAIGHAVNGTQLLYGAGKYMEALSRRRDPGYVNTIQWEFEAKVTPAMWTAAHYIRTQCRLPLDESNYQIVRTHVDDIYQVVSRDSQETFFSGDANHRDRLVADAVDNYVNNTWSCMSHLHAWLCFGYIVRRIPSPSGTEDQWHCHCEVHTREHVCEHVIAVRLFGNDLTMPTQHCAFKMKKRKSGRAFNGSKYSKVDCSGNVAPQQDSGPEDDAYDVLIDDLVLAPTELPAAVGTIVVQEAAELPTLVPVAMGTIVLQEAANLPTPGTEAPVVPMTNEELPEQEEGRLVLVRIRLVFVHVRLLFMHVRLLFIPSRLVFHTY